MTKLMITVEEGLSGKITLKRGPGGHIVCDDADKGVTAAAARESKPARESKESAKTESAKAKEPTKPTEPAAAKPARVTAKRATKPKRSTSLRWNATTDHGFTGWVAKTNGGGQFKLLRAKGSQWALFREQRGANPEPLGCYVKEDLGKAAAQRMHDTPAGKARPVTEVTVVEACPMPPGMEPEAPAEAEAPKRAEAQPPAPDAAKDAEMIESLKRTLAELEDE